MNFETDALSLVSKCSDPMRKIKIISFSTVCETIGRTHDIIIQCNRLLKMDHLRCRLFHTFITQHITEIILKQNCNYIA